MQLSTAAVVSDSPIKADDVACPAGEVFQVLRQWSGHVVSADECAQPVLFVELSLEQNGHLKRGGCKWGIHLGN